MPRLRVDSTIDAQHKYDGVALLQQKRRDRDIHYAQYLEEKVQAAEKNLRAAAAAATTTAIIAADPETMDEKTHSEILLASQMKKMERSDHSSITRLTPFRNRLEKRYHAEAALMYCARAPPHPGEKIGPSRHLTNEDCLRIAACNTTTLEWDTPLKLPSGMGFRTERDRQREREGEGKMQKQQVEEKTVTTIRGSSGLGSGSGSGSGKKITDRRKKRGLE